MFDIYENMTESMMEILSLSEQLYMIEKNNITGNMCIEESIGDTFSSIKEKTKRTIHAIGEIFKKLLKSIIDLFKKKSFDLKKFIDKYEKMYLKGKLKPECEVKAPVEKKQPSSSIKSAIHLALIEMSAIHKGLFDRGIYQSIDRYADKYETTNGKFIYEQKSKTIDNINKIFNMDKFNNTKIVIKNEIIDTTEIIVFIKEGYDKNIKMLEDTRKYIDKAIKEIKTFIERADSYSSYNPNNVNGYGSEKKYELGRKYYPILCKVYVEIFNHIKVCATKHIDFNKRVLEVKMSAYIDALKKSAK